MANFNSSLVVVEHQIMLLVSLCAQQSVMIDALCGDVEICRHEPSVLPTGRELDYQLLDRTSLLQIFLTQQKLAFIDENNYEKALCCIELLIQTSPDDPYQRRDRGFLLHRLDCFKLARDDFEFFIAQCPEDPAAQLLKMQLEEFQGREQTVH
jgi:regulator of sirC expression with transglutaminase-like and TPR domain